MPLKNRHGQKVIELSLTLYSYLLSKNLLAQVLHYAEMPYMETLNSAFIWERTTEGANFWRSLSKEYIYESRLSDRRNNATIRIHL